ncbi:MAG TPA: NAD(P)H-binding protein [Amycolatopsis sp.]|nr:NAD(P)H-binding protein [Amycolatopsis sp.]
MHGDRGDVTSTAAGNRLSIALVGASGNIGARIRDEALARGHAVTGVVRHVERLPTAANLTPRAASTRDPELLGRTVAGHDLVIVSVRWNENDIDQVLDAARRSGVARLIVVVGAGSLRMPDGRLYFDHNLDRGIAPPTSAAALQAFRRLCEVTDLSWTAVSPAANIDAGIRTGAFRIGADDLLLDDAGQSRISQEDFAVAVIDEAERPRHIRRRFTVAY